MVFPVICLPARYDQPVGYSTIFALAFCYQPTADHVAALSLAGSPGRSINRELGPPDNCPLPLVLLALFVGCLPLAAVPAVER
jgi:hypothetical protein